jgi:CDP-glucose 4,6-dehydratase
VPDCIRHLEKGEPIVVRNPHAIRPWQHVLEPLSGYLLLAERMHEAPERYASSWNFGPEDLSFLSVGSLVDLVVNAWGKGAWEDRSTPGAVHEAHLLKLDITKAKTLLGWSPEWKIERAVSETVRWYREYGADRVWNLCLKQIDDYMTG